MPTRRAKINRVQFDGYRAMQLLGGPNWVLLAGVGYLTFVARFEDLSEHDQQATLEQMRSDWQRHGEALTRWWDGDETAFKFRPWEPIGREPATPWALEQFGPPNAC